MATLTDHDVFWLARYAHNTLAPLFAEAKAIEPTIHFQIEMTFAKAPSTWDGNHITVLAHWKRAGMFQNSYCLRTKADLDWLAVKIRADIEKLKSEALQPA